MSQDDNDGFSIPQPKMLKNIREIRFFAIKGQPVPVHVMVPSWDNDPVAKEIDEKVSKPIVTAAPAGFDPSGPLPFNRNGKQA